MAIKVCLVKAMVFSVVMYGCESWTVKKAERQRINAFELWCYRRLLSKIVASQACAPPAGASLTVPLQLEGLVTQEESLKGAREQVCDTIQPSHPLSLPSPPAFNLSQHSGLFQ